MPASDHVLIGMMPSWPDAVRAQPKIGLTSALALLPWSACLAIGLIGFALWHAYAVSPLPPVVPGANGLYDAVVGRAP